jgi:membrane dipeptidase
LEVVERLNKLHMLIDLSHCGFKTTMDAIAHSRDPVVFTHTFAKSLNNHARGKTDEQLKALAEKGGYVGVMAVPSFITKDSHASLEHFFQHIDYIVKLIGLDHLAIGTDWYPPAHQGLSQAINNSYASIGFRPEDRAGNTNSLEGFEDWSDWPHITEGLLSRGYSSEDVKKILGGNFVRVFERVVG